MRPSEISLPIFLVFPAIKVDPETGELSDPTVSIVNPDDLPKTEGEEDDGPQREEFEGDFDPRLNVDLELTKKSVEYEHYLVRICKF